MSRDYRLDRNLPTAQQRRPEYVRDEAWIRDLLRRGQVAHIASIWDDQPFITPSIYFYDDANHRLIFHSNVAGRIRANIEHQPRVCAEVSELGKFLPSNVALEFSLQFRRRAGATRGHAPARRKILQQNAAWQRLSSCQRKRTETYFRL
jgi:uncharacterized protein YhbP (UPF0306 family)